MRNYDLASLAKPLVTAPLALTFLNLDQDYSASLGFEHSAYHLTARALLSHCSGLPPWLPFNGSALRIQIESNIPWGTHPLLRKATENLACYSDLNYRLLAEQISLSAKEDYLSLSQKNSPLVFFPWPQGCTEIPPGPDVDAWKCVAPSQAIPPYSPSLPHDINARAGMVGHAGFAANALQFKEAIHQWIDAEFPKRMAQTPEPGEHGSLWGLGLQQLRQGPGSLGSLLTAVPLGAVDQPLVIEGDSQNLSEEMTQHHEGEINWWGHLAFTGPALFYRPDDQACIAILTHRRGPQGELLSQSQIHARRIELLGSAVKSL